jgi:hypothetical protein
MDELLDFPESFPMNAVVVLAPIVRTRVVDDESEAARALVTLEAWAIGQWIATRAEAEKGPVPARAPVPKSVSDLSAKKALDALSAGPASGPEGAQSAPMDMRKFAEHALKLVKFVLPIILGL